MKALHFITSIEHADEMSHYGAKYDYRFIMKLDNELTVCLHPNCHWVTSRWHYE